MNKEAAARDAVAEKILSLPKLDLDSIVFGCDPEFFFKKDGKIIGSEKVIDLEKGLPVTNSVFYKDSLMDERPRMSVFIVDGVQAELNPSAFSCRQQLAEEIGYSFKRLKDHLAGLRGVTADFSTTVEMEPEEVASLSEKCQKFGCSPSKNTNKKLSGKMTVRDAKTYKYRSAGGHIHLGNYRSKDYSAVHYAPEKVINVMDILVGNTCVLLDRDPGNVERRLVYGRAGEYRTPEHGVEYRTLSNFWLRSYPLMSFVMGLSRMAVSIVENSTPTRDYYGVLTSLVNKKDIETAINTNDLKKAKENFDKIKPFIARIALDGLAAARRGEYENDTQYPLNATRLEKFEAFLEKPITEWWPQDPIEHWVGIVSEDVPFMGWERFIDSVAPKKK